MGYEVTRFQGDVDEELICPICSSVLQNPLQITVCEHTFCKECILEWVSRQPTCPVDRQRITLTQLRPVPRIIRNLLSRLVIACENVSYGCSLVVKLDMLESHLDTCEHNPKRPVPCEQGCGVVIPVDELKDHNCVRELRTLVQSYQQKMAEFQQELADHRTMVNNQKRELHIIKEFVYAMRMSNPAVAEQLEREEVIRWSKSLPRARVLRWGGMISTPDENLQSSIRRSLVDYGCPEHIIENLIGNCHERRWPSGLSCLETRQTMRRQFDNYVCRRVPGKQAVLALSCENEHMSADMMLEPGLVMIFAHGICD